MCILHIYTKADVNALSVGVRLLSKKLDSLQNGLQPPTNQKISN